jgi:hypothetical protein
MVYDEEGAQRNREWIERFEDDLETLIDIDSEWAEIERNALRSILADLREELAEYEGSRGE